ncbi:MAG: NAD(P)H-dependent oxidoreductase [Betaproteobacteria bacterium]
MGKRILVILGHPDPRPERLCRGLAEAYHRSATDAGHEVRVVDVTRLEFAALRSQADWEGAVPDGLRDAQEAIRWAEHLVIVFPIWLGTMPALLKAFFEQVLRPGFAMEVSGPGRWNKLLTGRSARLIVTMGMPAFLYRWYFRAHGIRSFERNVLDFVGIGPTQETLIGMVEGRDLETRQRWLAKVSELGRSGT